MSNNTNLKYYPGNNEDNCDNNRVNSDRDEGLQIINDRVMPHTTCQISHETPSTQSFPLSGRQAG
jgi:hypothetical protein